ncbi:MAG: glycosyltransferase family 2 protein [Eggerthella lenta]
MKRNGKQPVVSVIVPTYNAGEFVAQCLDSVLGQTMGDFELICVDDGSTDDTWAIVEERAQRDGRVAALRQANAGPGAARNAGLERACGRYVYCLDADDYLECDMLASCVKALDDAGRYGACGVPHVQPAGRHDLSGRMGMRHEDAFPRTLQVRSRGRRRPICSSRRCRTFLGTRWCVARCSRSAASAFRSCA